METYLECIPCFFKQGIESAKILGAGRKIQKQIVDRISGVIPSFPLEASPPEMGKIVHDIIKEILGREDPYLELKKKSNQLALAIYEKLRKKVRNSADRLLTGLELSTAGNIIDYGANHGVQPAKEVLKILERKIGVQDEKKFQYAEFKNKLKNSSMVLFLGDNAGEIVFDRLFIEEIKNLYPSKKIVYAVRETPVINDITAEDAFFVGMDKVADIVSSGSVIPGTLLSMCSERFVDLFNKADMVISKGQGNFETLYGANNSPDLFFLLTVKCGVVGKKFNAEPGDIILKKDRSSGREN